MGRGMMHLRGMEPTTFYRELASALQSRLAVIQDRAHYERDAADHLNALREASERIEIVAAGLPQPLDPTLAHYLERRSYDKALAWLEETLAART